MALRAVIDHPKFARLKRLLKSNKSATLGYLEALWHFCGRFTPAGDIGKYADTEIEAWLEWDGEDGALIAAYVAAGWLDMCPTHRLIVHDWHQHADDATRLALKRSKCDFVGTVSGQCRDSVAINATVSGLPGAGAGAVPEPDIKIPPFARATREEPPEPSGYHDAMPPIAMAAEMLLRTAIPFDVPLRDLVSQSIVGIARTEDVMLHKAADLLEARIRAAQLGGATVNRFWFADGRWRHCQQSAGGIRGSTEGNRKSPTVERNASMRDALAKAAIAQGNGSADDAVAADSG